MGNHSGMRLSSIAKQWAGREVCPLSQAKPQCLPDELKRITRNEETHAQQQTDHLCDRV
jgi:hypothetical protein